MFDWMRDLMQDRDIAAANRSISHARIDSQTQLKTLEDRVDALVLMNHALLSLLRDRVGITDDELAARMHELDLADGRADGKMAQPTDSCIGCGRALSGRRARCMYCGAARVGDGLPR